VNDVSGATVCASSWLSRSQRARPLFRNGRPSYLEASAALQGFHYSCRPQPGIDFKISIHDIALIHVKVTIDQIKPHDRAYSNKGQTGLAVRRVTPLPPDAISGLKYQPLPAYYDG
jgi:hypothetical protein